MYKKLPLLYSVFVSGAAVMALEVIGLGMLAPYFSTALVVQTNVIGVVLFGLAIGYRWGGVAADRSATYTNLYRVLLCSALWVGVVLAFREVIANAIGWYTESTVYGSLLSSFVFFFPPAVTLGTVLPYAIKLHVDAVCNSGRSSGLLYGLSAVGSIFGTLAAAFLILPSLRHAGSLLCISVALLIGALLVATTKRRRALVLGTAIVSYIVLIQISVPPFLFRKQEIFSDGRLRSNINEWKELADEPGVFSRIQVYEGTELGTKRPIRLMAVNGEVHSGTYLDSNDLLFHYARYNRLGGHFNPAAKRALLVGGGGYSYANYFLTDTPLYDTEKVWALNGSLYHNGKTVSLPILFTDDTKKRARERELVYTSQLPPEGRQIEGTRNHIEAHNQSPSSTVIVAEANIHDTGFDVASGYVHIHETKDDGTPGRIISDDIPLTEYLVRPRTIIGKGDLLSGDNSDVPVRLDRPATENEVLFAMLHRDNGNEHFDDFLVDGYEQTEALDVVEIDPRTARLAEQYFHLNRDDPRLRIFEEDARTYFNRTEEKYDIIYLDAFRSFYAVPWQLTTIEATRRLYDMLNENGVLVANVPASLDGEYSKFFQAEYKTYQMVFPEVRVYAATSPRLGEIVQNIILVAFKTKETIREEPNDDPEINEQLAHRWYGKVSPDTPILTDDFAPTDYYTNFFARLHLF